VIATRSFAQSLSAGGSLTGVRPANPVGTSRSGSHAVGRTDTPRWRVRDYLLGPIEALDPDRLLEIARLRAEGYDLPESGRTLGISSQAVREGLRRAAGDV
jgi:hypothetical protein